jgi:hypothetical protein
MHTVIAWQGLCNIEGKFLLNKMKTLLLLFSLIFSQGPSVFAQEHKSSIVGKWSTEKGKIIKIVRADGQFEGTTLDGAPILRDLTYTDESWNGTIQNRSGSMSARCVIIMQEDDKIKITARKGIFTKRFYWTRAQ